MNYLQTIKFGSHKIKSNNIYTHMFYSELLKYIILKTTREKILDLDKNIKRNNFNKFKKLISRRQKNEPILYH